MGEARRRRKRRRRRGRDLGELDRVARERFGIDRLRPHQRELMEAIRCGRDALAVLPAGFGKSLVYQVPALLAERPTVVVSPLLALIGDQVASLRRRGVPVIRLDSSLRAGERREALAQLERGGALVVFTTPETIASEPIEAAIGAARPWLVCVDEAHCISQWGHDFRPAYLRLGTERTRLGDPIVLALTATATPHVQRDIAEQLKLREPLVVTASPCRENLRFSVQIVQPYAKPTAAGVRLRSLPRPGIVYCATTTSVDTIWNALQSPGARDRVPALRYHGKLKASERDAAHERFMRPGERHVMIATSAFGMGVDKPDIRYVLHYEVPGSLEQYVQEAGRGGRDGKATICELLFDPADLELQRFLLEKSGRAALEDEERLQHVLGYALTEECRAVFLRRYFGELDPPRCGVCDRCRARARQ